MRHEAWLVLESGERCECALSDISHIGARVNIPDSDVIPDNFMLFLAESGVARRRGRVIWRKPRELGVKFETRLDHRIAQRWRRNQPTALRRNKSSRSKTAPDRRSSCLLNC